MYKGYVERALSMYGIDSYRQLLPMQSGYRNEIYPAVLNDPTTIQLTFYKREPEIIKRINISNQVSEFLAKQGTPTRVRYDKRILQLRSSKGVVYVGIYNYLPGETIPWEAYTRKHIKLLGKTLSDLHDALRGINIGDNIDIVDEYSNILTKMARYFETRGVKVALHDKLNIKLNFQEKKYRKLLEGCRTLPGKQQLHMDFVRGNILFKAGKQKNNTPEISGILDFEKTGFGHPLLDVARTLAFLLVDCKYKDGQEVWRLFVHSGYQKQGAASLPATGLLLDRLVGFFLAYDFYKFLKHNPYEFLHENEHFMRTKVLLARRGVINLV